jgi:hypothetical protein
MNTGWWRLRDAGALRRHRTEDPTPVPEVRTLDRISGRDSRSSPLAGRHAGHPARSRTEPRRSASPWRALRRHDRRHGGSDSGNHQAAAVTGEGASAKAMWA